MGLFMGHVLPGTLFLAVGAWRVWSSVARFAADPSAFRVRAWNPVGSAGGGHLRLLELYVVAGGAFLDMCLELSGAIVASRGGGGVDPGTTINYLEHVGMLLMFFLFGALALVSEKTRCLPLTDGALCLVASTAFTSELLLFYFHSATHAGLEAYYHHHVLVLLVGLCIVATVLGTLLPESFPVDLATGVLLVLKGLWFYQIAMTLYGPMLPTGCARDATGHIDCHDRAAQERAEQLADVQLFGLVFLAFVYVLGCYAVAAARYGHPDLTAMHEKHVDAMDCRGLVAAGAEEESA